jgi:hypothetical protein
MEGKGMMKRVRDQLTAVESSHKSRYRLFDVIGASIERLPIRIALSMLASGFLVGLHGTAEAAPLHWVGHVTQEIKDIHTYPSRIGPDVTQFATQLVSGRVGQLVELLTLVPVQAEVVSDERAQQKTNDSPKKGRAGAGDPNRKEIKHHWFSYVLLALSGLIPAMLGAFSIHAYKYGLNDAWRDLVFSWPIPYWMRFVPKDEQ